MSNRIADQAPATGRDRGPNEPPLRGAAHTADTVVRGVTVRGRGARDASSAEDAGDRRGAREVVRGPNRRNRRRRMDPDRSPLELHPGGSGRARGAGRSGRDGSVQEGPDLGAVPLPHRDHPLPEVERDGSRQDVAVGLRDALRGPRIRGHRRRRTTRRRHFLMAHRRSEDATTRPTGRASDGVSEVGCAGIAG